jgi:gamma-glutamyltranspeptidase / glutathione hydrolase
MGIPAFSGNSSCQAAEPGYDRPAANPYQSRSVVIAHRGMVATSHPLAAQAGLDILKQGGNAVDAAIATNAMLGVVEPMSCGIGGDLFVIYWDAKTKQLHGLNASGRSPKGLTIETFRELGMDQIPVEGILSWSVPGCVDGWDVLRERFGTLPLADLLDASIEYSEEGFPVSEIIGRSWQGSVEKLAHYPDSAATYLIDGRAPRIGEIVRNPNLARSYRLLAERGRDAFYNGPIAHTIVEYSREHGGHFTLEDFAEHISEWVDPVSTNYRGYDVWELPPNGQGIAALQMLNVLEAYDVAAMGPNSPDYLHLLIEAKKLAFADRAKFYADPAFNDPPVRELISKEYAATQRQRIDMQRAATDVPAGDPKLTHGDTVYLCTVDAEGNCCSFIQSIYYGFGSQVVPGEVGFAMQNRGSSFSLDPEHANALEPKKRPFHTIIPAMVTRTEQDSSLRTPWLVFGVMGGDMQPQGHVQVLVNLIDFGMNVQEAGDAARVRHLGSQTPTGLPMQGSGEVAVESRIPAETVRELQRRGHRIVQSPGGFGGYQAILIDPDEGALHGGTDPRKDGAAVGY